MTGPRIIPRQPPRDLEALGLESAIGFMIRVKIFVAWLLIVGGALMTPIAVLVVAATATSDKPTMPLGGALTMAAVALAQLVGGLWWRSRLKVHRERRRNALERGRCVRGVVESSHPAPGLSLAMGSLDRRYVIRYEALDGTTKTTSFLSPLGVVGLRSGAPVEGVLDPETGDLLFPAELGLHVTFQ